MVRVETFRYAVATTPSPNAEGWRASSPPPRRPLVRMHGGFVPHREVVSAPSSRVQASAPRPARNVPAASSEMHVRAPKQPTLESTPELRSRTGIDWATIAWGSTTWVRRIRLASAQWSVTVGPRPVNDVRHP